MKFLLAGLGSIGRRHFRNLLALGERDILFYRSHKSTLSDDELAGYPVETDLQRAFAHKPDAVIISNPTALHLSVAIPAAEVGCHLFLEKPISNSLEGIDNLQRTVAHNNVRTQVGFQFRFHPGLKIVQEWLSHGEIGHPISVKSHWGEHLPDWHPWEDFRKGYAARSDLGGGVILTLCHPLDYLRMLFGEVSQVWCFSGRQGHHLPVEDTAEIGLRFANGMVGNVHLNYVQRPTRHDLEITGTEGTIRWDNADGSAHINKASVGRWETISVHSSFERNTMFVSEIKNFLGVIRNEEKPICTLGDGIQALRLALAASSSAQDGKVVTL
jgi:predicted dehydrogenase